MKRFVLSLMLAGAVLGLAACKKTEEAAPAPTQAAAPSDAELLAQAEAAKANGGGDAAASTDAGAPVAAPTADAQGIPGLTLGADYTVVPNGQPFEPLNGKIEVVEVFNFVCPACAMFQPLVVQWKKNLPADVRFTYVPAAFGGNWDQFVRAYYAAETMGLADKAHEAMYDAIHLDEVLKGERGKDSDEDIAKFYAKFGADPKAFAAAMRSFAVTGKFNRASQYIRTQGVNSTPTLIVNGKYMALGRNFEDRFRVVNALIAHERAQAAAAQAPAPAPAQ